MAWHSDDEKTTRNDAENKRMENDSGRARDARLVHYFIFRMTEFMPCTVH